MSLILWCSRDKQELMRFPNYQYAAIIEYMPRSQTYGTMLIKKSTRKKVAKNILFFCTHHGFRRICTAKVVL